MNSNMLALKAINQARGHDIFTYLGLRYYLENACARRNGWIEEVSTSLVFTRTDLPYLRTYHFKKIMEDGSIKHRNMYWPGPNESLAEAAIIAECSRHKEFRPKSFVYSYRMADRADPRGVFEYYFDGFRCRQKDISACCSDDVCEMVLVTDIVKFYPSISKKSLHSSWVNACLNAGLSSKLTDLGVRIMADHFSKSLADDSPEGLLTGPLISHVLANLVLSDVDGKMHEITKGKYWRYVDDIVIVGSSREVAEWRMMLNDLLGALSLKLHDQEGGKDYKISASAWNDGFGKEDYISREWSSLLGCVKKYLYYYPGAADSLAEMFDGVEMRLPIPRYTAAIGEEAYSRRTLQLMARYGRWFVNKFNNLSLESIRESAMRARDCYWRLAVSTLSQDILKMSSFDRKRVMSKLRFCCGRLLVLATKSQLESLLGQIKMYEELVMMSEIMYAVVHRDANRIVHFGTNAVQAAAQLLKTSCEAVTCNSMNDDVSWQGLTMLLAHGVNIRSIKARSDDYLCQLIAGDDILNLMSCKDPYVREVACLHGVGDIRHAEVINSAFSVNEQLRIDVVDRLQNYPYT